MKKAKAIFFAFKEIHYFEKYALPVSVTASVFSAIIPFINIWFTSKIIDLLTIGTEFKNIAVYFSSAVILNFTLNFVKNYCIEKQYIYRASIYIKEKKKIVEKLFKVPYKTIDNTEYQELIHKHSESQDRVFSAFIQLIWMMNDFISGIITVIISVIIIWPLFKIGFTKTGDTFFEKPFFLITIFFAIVIMVAIILIVAIKMNKNWFEASNEYSKLDRIFYYFLNLFSDYNTGKEIRLYKEQNLIEHIATDKILNDGEKVLKKASLYSARSSSFVAILGAIVGFGIYLFIGVKGLFGLFSIGSLVLYSGSFMQIINGIMKMSATFGKTEGILPLINYYFEIVNTEDKMFYGSKVLDLSDNIEIEFKNVSFKYPGAENYSLKNVNLTIHNGERLAVVGKNGSGKTTFIKLMCRFYDVTDGEILINGTNIKEYTEESIMKLYSVVFQDFKIFSTTLAQNVSAGKDYDSKKLFDVLERSNIKDRVLKMPDKEKTYLYKDLEKTGVEISGGEAQKIALARALYKDAPVVILDEPTAALDPLAEYEVYSRFNSFVQNKTAIYISHRLSSCAFCTDIAVFDKGELAETGSHEELLNKNGVYSKLWNSQAKYYL